MPDVEIGELDSDFTIIEINKAIKKLARYKAPGNDGIPNEIWRASMAEFKEELLYSLNQILQKEIIPENWSETVIVPLFKKNNPELPENYRPVSLANTVLKLFTIMVGERLNNWNSKTKVISDYQAAYKKGNGCMNHVFILNSALQYNVNRGKKVYALFVDLSQAFDTVNHAILWEKLHKKGLSTKFVNIVKSLYSNAKARNQTNYDVSDWFPIKRGVLQGETISPILWNIYLEDIVEELNQSETISLKVGRAIVHLPLYADDIVLY